MTTYYSDRFRSDGTVKARKDRHGGVWAVTGTYTVAAAITASDIFKMIPVPAGARVKDVILQISDLDTGSSLVLDVGDGDGTPDLDRYIAGGTTTDTAAVIRRMSNVAGMNYQFAADGTIDVDVNAAPQTSATSGTICVTAFFSRDGIPS